jgi:hypothetical protein
MYGVDWHHPPMILDTPIQVVLHDPWRFTQAYWHEVLLRWDVLVPFLLIMIVEPRWRTLAVGSVVFVLATTTAASARGTIPIQALSVLAWGTLLILLVERPLKRTIPRLAVDIVAAAILIAGAAGAIRGALHAAARVQEYRAVEQQVLPFVAADRIVTDDLSLYFPQSDDQPFKLGGWGAVGIEEQRIRVASLVAAPDSLMAQALASTDFRAAILQKHSGNAQRIEAIKPGARVIGEWPHHVAYLVDQSTHSGAASN